MPGACPVRYRCTKYPISSLRVYGTVRNEDWVALQSLRAQCCPGADCVCVYPPSDGWSLSVFPISQITLVVQRWIGARDTDKGRGEGLPLKLEPCHAFFCL